MSIQNPSILTLIYNWNGRLYINMLIAKSQRHSGLLTNKSTLTRAAHEEGRSYNQIGNSWTFRANMVLASFKPSRSAVRRKCGLRRGRGRRRLDLLYLGLSLSLVERFFSTLGLLSISLNVRLHFRGNCRRIRIEADRWSGGVYDRFASLYSLGKVDNFGVDVLLPSPRGVREGLWWKGLWRIRRC